MPARDQATSRTHETFVDQHGREWDVTLDNKNNRFCTPPYPRFKEPVVTPLQYVGHGRRLGQLVIDYDAWLRDNGAREDEIQSTLVTLAADLEPNRVAEAIETPSASMLRVLGGNMLPHEFILAKKAGNRWALGLSAVEPRWLTDDLKARLAQHLGRTTRQARAAEDLSRFRDDIDADDDLMPPEDPRLAQFQDLEEAVDPHATGGQRVPVRSHKKRAVA